MGVIALFIPIIYLISPITRCCESDHRVSKLRRNLNKSLYWGFMLRGLVEAYIIIAICALINFKQLQLDGDWEVVNTALSISMLLGLISFPIFISMFLHKNKYRLSDKSNLNMYGTLYAEMRTDLTDNSLIKYSVYYYLRRLVLACTVVWLGHVLVI